MAFATILRQSARQAFPFASRAISSQANHHAQSIATAAVISAVKRTTLSPRFLHSATYSSSRRHFSSSVDFAKTSSDEKLLEVIESEINVVEESDDFDKAIEAPSGFPFKIEDNVGEQTVTLTREYEGETITVKVSMPNIGADEGDEDNDDDDEESHHDSSVPLLVTVSKKNGPSLEFDCSAYPDEISIDALTLKKPDSEDLAYEGPDFLDLDENLQKAFHKYLEIRGIKPSTTNFLHEYMTEKDNKEYLRWLKDIKKFVKA